MIEKEMRIIGAIVVFQNDLPEKAFNRLQEKFFISDGCRCIYRLIKSRIDKMEAFDEITLTSMVIDEHYKLLLSIISHDRYAVTYYFEQDVEDVIVAWQFREMSDCLKKLNKREVDTKKKVDGLLKKVEEVQLVEPKNELTYEDILKGGITDNFIKCGITFVDKVYGLALKSMVTICGQSGSGKTYFGLYVMHKILELNGGDALFFSMELPAVDLMTRHLSIAGGKNYRVMSEEEKAKAIEKCKEMNVRIIDEQRLTISDIERRCKAHKGKLTVVVVDYLGLIQADVKSERYYLDQVDITQRLAALSIRHNCVVIALLQMNRDAKNRKSDDKCPYMTDAADSSGSERASTLWLGICRNEDNDQLFDVKCRKNRHGMLFEGQLQFANGTFREMFW